MLSSANIKKVMAFLILLQMALYKFVLLMTPVTRSIKMTISLTIMYIFWSSMLLMKGIT